MKIVSTDNIHSLFSNKKYKTGDITQRNHK